MSSAKVLIENEKKGFLIHSQELTAVESAQTLFAGADPKSVLCAFYKQGLCGKGDKCKFSHNLSVERKGEKRSLYTDMRDDELENGKLNFLFWPT